MPPLATAAIVDSVAQAVEDRHVLPDRGRAAGRALRAAARAGAYEGLDGEALCRRLTEDLQRHGSDRHLGVRWFPEPRRSEADPWQDPDFVAAYAEESALNNHGVVRAERLPGNIGYLEVRGVDEPELTGATVVAAMGFLARTSALIVDLRAGPGGAPTGAAFWVGHLTPEAPVHLLDVIDRDHRIRQQTWTPGYLPGPRYDNPVYVLTSSRTVSGLEELAYDLQALGRATLVGERTLGAGNPVELVQVLPQVAVRIPLERVRSAVTGGSWEGLGVTPDVEWPAGEALVVAHRMAARAVQDSLGPEPRRSAAALAAELDTLLR